MSFRGKDTFLMMFLIGVLSSCSWWGGEKDQSSNITIDSTDVLRFGDVSCIKNIGSFFSDYFHGRSSTYEIDDMKVCIETTLDTMFDFAYKDDEVGFNRERMKNVLTSVIGENDSFDLEELSDLIFLLKRFFVGGGKNNFYKEEWESFKPALNDIALALDESKLSAKTIFFSSKDVELLAREKMYTTLEKSFKSFDEIKNKYAKTLEIEELESLVSALLSVSSLDIFTPVALTGRKILYPIESIFEAEQKNFMSVVWDVFYIQSRLRELNFSQGLLIGESNGDLIKLTRVLTSRLKSWSSTYSDEYFFTTETIKKMITHFYDIGFFANKISGVKPINDTIENMFIRVFGGASLTVEDFELLDDVFENWASYYPKLIANLDDEWAKDVYSILKNDSQDLKSSSTIDRLLGGFDEPKFVSGPSSPIHILYDKDRELSPLQLYFDKALKHIFLVLAEPITKAYNPEINSQRLDADVVFNTDGLDRLLIDFRPLGLELGFINRYSCDSSTRIYIESNLLTQNANGDEFISLIEAAEWLGTMISTSSLTNHIFSKVKTECAYQGEEVYSYPFYKRSCFKESMFNDPANLESYFPGLLNYLSILRSPDQRNRFQDQIDGWFNYANSYYEFNELNDQFFETVFMNQMNTCLQVKDDSMYLEFPLSRSEFNATIATLIYVENFFAKYDTTGVGGLISSGLSGPDLIIDGQELSNFIKDKVHRDEYQNLIVAGIRENAWARRFGSAARWKKRIKNLPEWAALMDRQRLTDLIHSVMSDIADVDQLEENFCEQIMESSLRGSVISFDTEAALQCPAVD